MLRKFFNLSINQLFIVLLSVLLNNLLAEQNTSSLPEGVSIYQLDNGIQVLLIEKPALPMVGVNTVVKVGSAYESFATSGMSHMLEHLLFNGTTTMTQKELYDATDKIGGYNNANTSEYYTNYMMVTPAENIIDGMKLQAAMLFNSVLPEEKFEKEKGIVLEEIAKSLANASEQLERNAASIIYKGHALSLPTLGTYETIKNMVRNDVNKFYKNYYVPNNMIISVIGGFDTKEMLQNLKDIYGKAKPGDVKYPENTELNYGFLDIPFYENTQSVFHRFYNGKKTQLQVFFEVDSPRNSELFNILQIILNEKKKDFEDELNNKYNNAVEGIEFSTRTNPVKNYLQATVVLKEKADINQLNNSVISMLRNCKYEISKEAIETESIKSRTMFLKNTEKPHMFGIYNAGLFAEKGIESILAAYSGEGFYSAADELKEFKLNMEPITIVQHPEIEKDSLAKLEQSKPVSFDGNNKIPTIIAKRNKGSNLLAIHYLIKNKAAYESKFGKDAAKFWHDAFGKRMKSPEIKKIISKYGFTFVVNDNPFIPMDNIYLSPEFGYIRVEGLADDTESAIDFLNKQMLNFVPTEEEFTFAQSKSKRPAMMGHGNEAKKKFNSKLDELLYEKPNYTVNNEPVTYEKLLEFGKYYFTPSNMIISVVSPEENSDIKNYFSSFAQEAPADAIDKSAFIKAYKSITSPIKIELEEKSEQAYLYYGFQKNIDLNDKAALKVLSLLLSDKIVFDIREKQGMAYRMSAGVDVKKDKAMFYINMGTRPENVDKLTPQFPKFFSEKYLGEITRDDVTKSVNMYLGRMMFRRLSSINQAYYLGHSKYFHNNIFYDSNFLDNLKTVSVEDVERVVRKYMIIENPVEIIVR